VVVNDIAQPGIGFDTAENEVTIITAAGDEHVAQTTKAEVARAILATVDRLRAAAAKAGA
jgi:phosphopantothenoylcysteine decarboxylase/phosphopantothenate--cysteine ligase